MLRNAWLLATFICALTLQLHAGSYGFVEGYNVLDTNNAPNIGTNFAATAGLERDIAVDAARGIIYQARGQTSTQDRPGGVVGIAAIVITNGALPGSNFRDTGLITGGPGQGSLAWCQSLAYDSTSDRLWALGGPLGAAPAIFFAPGGTLGGAPDGGNPAAANAVLTKAFTVDTNLLDVGVYVSPSVSTNGVPGRGGAPRGFAVRTVNGTNTTVYLGMGNHVQAWSNDGTNGTWRRAWATMRPPAGNFVTTRVALTGFNGVNGLAVDDGGNCYFSVQNTGGRIWCVRPELIQGLSDRLSLDFNDIPFGGSSEREVISLIYTATPNAPIVATPQALTFSRLDNQRTLFASFMPGAAQRAITRLAVSENISFTNGGAFVPAQAIDGFGSGQPAAGQDTILSTMRTKQTSTGQPQGTSNNTLYHDVDSVTNPTYLYVQGFVIDTNKGQTTPTAAVIKVRIQADTNPPSITTQPASQTLLEGGTIQLAVGVSGAFPLSYQWQSNSVDIPGAVGPSLVINPATTNQSLAYRVIVTNALGSVTSLVANVTVQPLLRSTALTPLWSLAPGSRPYLTTDDRQRGLAYNPDGGQLLIASRAPGPGIYVLDGQTGADLYQLGLGSIVTGGTFVLNRIGTSDDGKVYAANLAQNGEDFRIYYWSAAIANDPPQLAYAGNPTPGSTNRWGDTFDVRGSGNGIQIIAGSRQGKVVALFTTADDGATFQATPITVSDAVNGSLGLGLAFGAGNTFWGKGDGSNTLRQVQFDPGTSNGTTLHSFSTTAYTANAPLAISVMSNLLGSISVENPDNVRLYTLYDLAQPPVLVDQELFPTDNDNINGTASLDFGGGVLYALDSNNGIVALTVGAIPPPNPGPLLITRDGAKVKLTWSGNFVLRAASVVTGPYEIVTEAVSGYEVTPSPGSQQFFRLSN